MHCETLVDFCVDLFSIRKELKHTALRVSINHVHLKSIKQMKNHIIILLTS